MLYHQAAVAMLVLCNRDVLPVQAPGSRLLLLASTSKEDVMPEIIPKLDTANCGLLSVRFPPYDTKSIQAILQQRFQLLPGPPMDLDALAEIASKASCMCPHDLPC